MLDGFLIGMGNSFLHGNRRHGALIMEESKK
jgi:hypothetical protein